MMHAIMSRHEQNDAYCRIYEPHTGRIKITSGEQFVPIFLALYSDQDRTNATLNYLLEDGRNPIVELDQQELAMLYRWPKLAEKVIKRRLMRNLDSEPPKEYVFYKPNLDGVTMLDVAQRVFHGDTTLSKLYYYSTGSSVVTFGALIDCEGCNGAAIIKSPYYGSMQLNGVGTRYFPKILIVVKAKHLKYIRACVLLREPMSELPYGDIKLLRNNILHTTQESLISFARGNDRMKVEFSTYEKMRTYIQLPEEVMRPKECLAKARKVLTDTENNVYHPAIV